MIPRHSDLVPTVAVVGMLACSALVSSPVKAGDIADLVKARCGSALLDYDRLALTEKDLFGRVAPEGKSEAEILASAWYAMNYSVVDHAVFTLDAAKMNPEKRARVADGLGAAVELMNCLAPSDFGVFAKLEARDRADIEATAQCLPEAAGRMVALLRSDAKGEVLTAGLTAASGDMKTNCKKKG